MHAKNAKNVHRGFLLRQIPIDRRRRCRRFQQRDNEYIGVESRRRDPVSNLLIVGLEEIRRVDWCFEDIHTFELV